LTDPIVTSPSIVGFVPDDVTLTGDDDAVGDGNGMFGAEADPPPPPHPVTNMSDAVRMPRDEADFHRAYGWSIIIALVIR
jgi:hypothetical protein